jgi:hypothetical protein
MQRTYLATLGPGGLLAAVVPLISLPLALLPLVPLPAAQAEVLFESRGVEASRFVILAKPVARSDWSLVVLEQLQPAPACWRQRPDGLIDASLTRFDYTGICSRYIDSNGYSLRIGNVDLAKSYRLQLRQVGRGLQLLGSSPDAPRDLLLGRGTVPRRDRDGFVAIKLEPDWQLRRRTYGGQSLSHIYFATDTSLAQLTVSGEEPPSPRAVGPVRTGSMEVAPRNPFSRQGYGNGPIALKVIPFQP